MFLESFGSARVALFHHFQTVGGNVYNNHKSNGCIQGIEAGLTVNITPDVEILFRKPPVAATQVPTTTSLLGIKKSDDLIQLKQEHVALTKHEISSQ